GISIWIARYEYDQLRFASMVQTRLSTQSLSSRSLKSQERARSIPMDEITLGPILMSIGCGAAGLSIGMLCYYAKAPIWVGALLFSGIFLMVLFHG
ncbi:hypothetical protein LCGC14_1257620, partial [marine sediment metagenome]